MIRRRDDLVELTQKLLRAEVDYGLIPGTHKPTLFKPGAEKLLRWMGLVVDCRLMPHSRLDVMGDALDVDVEGVVLHAASQTRLGTLHANCNSQERRYLNAREKGAQTLADQKNTIIKMAEKRVVVAAALLYTMASEVYTQDLEDTGAPASETAPQAGSNGSAKCPKCNKGNLVERKRKSDGEPFWACDAGRYDTKTKTRSGCDYIQNEPPGEEGEHAGQPMPPKQSEVELEKAALEPALWQVWGERGLTVPIACASSLWGYMSRNLLTGTEKPTKATDKTVRAILDVLNPDQLRAYISEQQEKLAAETAKEKAAPSRAELEMTIANHCEAFGRPVPDLKAATLAQLQEFAADCEARELAPSALGDEVERETASGQQAMT